LFVIHNGEGYEKMKIPYPDLFPENSFVTRKVYYGTPLRDALENIYSAGEEKDFSQDFSWLDRISMLSTTNEDGSSTEVEEAT